MFLFRGSVTESSNVDSDELNNLINSIMESKEVSESKLVNRMINLHDGDLAQCIGRYVWERCKVRRQVSSMIPLTRPTVAPKAIT